MKWNSGTKRRWHGGKGRGRGRFGRRGRLNGGSRWARVNRGDDGEMSGRRGGRTSEGKERAVNPFAELRCFCDTVMSVKTTDYLISQQLWEVSPGQSLWLVFIYRLLCSFPQTGEGLGLLVTMSQVSLKLQIKSFTSWDTFVQDLLSSKPKVKVLHL